MRPGYTEVFHDSVEVPCILSARIRAIEHILPHDVEDLVDGRPKQPHAEPEVHDERHDSERRSPEEKPREPYETRPFRSLDEEAILAAFLIGEFAADQQQWDFHRAKKAAGGTLEPGFLTTGMFAYSRHPNFFFEQAQWWAFYAIGATAAVSAGLGMWGGALNWTIAGAALLTVLFIGSTIFTESITSSKYPGYADYQRTTSMLVPLPPRRRADAPKTA